MAYSTTPVEVSLVGTLAQGAHHTWHFPGGFGPSLGEVGPARGSPQKNLPL